MSKRNASLDRNQAGRRPQTLWRTLIRLHSVLSAHDLLEDHS